jgi:hypothetical protein
VVLAQSKLYLFFGQCLELVEIHVLVRSHIE